MYFIFYVLYFIFYTLHFVFFSGVGFVRPGLGSLVSRMVSRRHYITAYRKALQVELKKASSIFSTKPTAALLEIEKCLYRELNELHRILTTAEILIFRNFVLTILQRQGENTLNLKAAMLACSRKSIYYCNYKRKDILRINSDDNNDENDNEGEEEEDDDITNIHKNNSYSQSISQSQSQSKLNSKGMEFGRSKIGPESKEENNSNSSNSSSSVPDPPQGYLSPKELKGNQSNGTLSVTVALSVSRLALTILEEDEVEREVEVEVETRNETERDQINKFDSLQYRGRTGSFNRFQSRSRTRSRSRSRSLSMSMSRSFYQDEKQTGENVKNIFSFVIYETEVNVHSVRDHEKTVSVRIRSVRAYGMKGTEIITCGADPNESMEEEFRKDKGDGQMDVTSSESALYLSIGMMAGNTDADEFERKIINTTDDKVTDISSSSSNNKGLRGYVRAELVLSSLSITWDSETLHRLRQLGEELFWKHSTSSPLELLSVAGAHPYAAHRLKASQLSMSSMGGTSSVHRGFRY